MLLGACWTLWRMSCVKDSEETREGYTAVGSLVHQQTGIQLFMPKANSN